MKQIPLTRGKFALVDDEDYDWLNQWKWCAWPRRKTWYAVRTVHGVGRATRRVYMHCAILNVPKGTLTDHSNGNGLDNRRSNIRTCDAKQNSRNRRLANNNKSGFKGVSWKAAKRKWVATITVDGNCYYLGSFTCVLKAAKIYDAAAKVKFGDFAYLNFT